MCTSIATMSSRVHVDFSTSISLAPTDNGSVNVDRHTCVVDAKFDLAKHLKMRSTMSRDLSGLSKELLVVVLVVVVVLQIELLLLLLPLPEGRLLSCVRILRLLYTVSQHRLHDSWRVEEDHRRRHAWGATAATAAAAAKRLRSGVRPEWIGRTTETSGARADGGTTEPVLAIRIQHVARSTHLESRPGNLNGRRIITVKF